MTLQEAVRQAIEDHATYAVIARTKGAPLGPFVGRVISVHGLVWPPREIHGEVRRQIEAQP